MLLGKHADQFRDVGDKCRRLRSARIAMGIVPEAADGSPPHPDIGQLAAPDFAGPPHPGSLPVGYRALAPSGLNVPGGAFSSMWSVFQ